MAKRFDNTGINQLAEESPAMSMFKQYKEADTPVKPELTPSVSHNDLAQEDTLTKKEAPQKPSIEADTSKEPEKTSIYYSAPVETKTQRLQLVLKPSLFKGIKAKAKRYHLSVNEYVHKVLEADLALNN